MLAFDSASITLNLRFASEITTPLRGFLVCSFNSLKEVFVPGVLESFYNLNRQLQRSFILTVQKVFVGYYGCVSTPNPFSTLFYCRTSSLLVCLADSKFCLSRIRLASIVGAYAGGAGAESSWHRY